MKLRTLALGAVLLAAAVPALSSPASADGYEHRHHGRHWASFGSTAAIVFAGYYPIDAYYYPPPYEGFGPVGPFIGHDDWHNGIWHPGYWTLGHRGHRYIAGSWW